MATRPGAVPGRATARSPIQALAPDSPATRAAAGAAGARLTLARQQSMVRRLSVAPARGEGQQQLVRDPLLGAHAQERPKARAGKSRASAATTAQSEAPREAGRINGNMP